MAVLLIFASVFISAPVPAAHPEGSQVLAESSVEGSGAFAVAIDPVDPGRKPDRPIGFGFTLNAHGPASSEAIGLLIYREGHPVSAIVFAYHMDSQDRHVLVINDETPSPSWNRGFTMRSHDDPPGQQDGPWVAHTDECAKRCITVTTTTSEAPVPHTVMVWGGDFSQTDIVVFGEAEYFNATIAEGTPHVLTTQDFINGSVNFQHQDTDDDLGKAGGVVIKDAGKTIGFDHRAYGLWSFNRESGMSCVPGTCITHSAPPHLGSLSWKGPYGIESPGGQDHSFFGLPGGEYEFIIDRMVDAYHQGTLLGGVGSTDMPDTQVSLVMADLPDPRGVP